MVGLPLGVVAGDMLPHSAEHLVPSCESVHATPLLAKSFPTVATNSCEMFSGSKALFGAAVTLSVPGAIIAVIVTRAEADAAVVLAEIAVMVITKSPAG